jgi:hypothetical protein
MVDFGSSVSAAMCDLIDGINKSLDTLDNVINASLFNLGLSSGDRHLEVVYVGGANLDIWNFLNQSHGKKESGDEILSVKSL